MKKLMIALAAAATTMFSFGDLPTGTSFEALTEGPVDVGGIVNRDDSGDQSGSEFYWYSTAPATDELGAITNDVASGVSRPDLFANQNQANTKSLQIDTTAPLVRTALPNAGASSVTGVAIGNDGIYLDTLVKFTAADEAFAEDLTGGDKIAIEYVEHEAEEGDEGYTNFVIRAGFIAGAQQIDQTNYFAAVPANFDKDAWHRLTVRTIADVGDGHVGFVIYLDGDIDKTLEYSTNVVAGFGTLNATAAKFYNSEKHALFPSAIAAGATGGSTISSVAFSGNGFIDDVSFAAEAPNFIKAGEAVPVAITLGTGVTGVTVTVGENTYAPVDATATPLVFNLPAGTTSFDLAVTADTDNGYTFDGATGITAENASYNNGTVTISGGSPALTVVGKRDNAYYMDGETKVGFATLSEAFASAPANATIKLGYNYSVAGNETTSPTLPVYTITKNLVLDLNGKTLDGGSSTVRLMFNVVQDVDFTVIDSVVGDTGSIVYGGTFGIFGGDGNIYIGSTTLTDYGPVIEGWLLGDITTGGGYLSYIFRGKFSALENTVENDFDAALFVDPGSNYSLAGDYWVVEPQGVIGTYTVTVTPTANATYSAVYTDSGDAIEPVNNVYTVVSGKTITITATPAEGFEYASEPDGWTLSEGVITKVVNEAVAIPAPTAKQIIGTYEVVVTPDANATYAAICTNDNSAVVFNENITTVRVGYAIMITATPNANYAYATTPDGWTAGENGVITKVVDDAGTVAIPAPTATGSYPTYINGIEDATAKAAYEAKYDTWKTTYGADTSSEHEAAFLLNIAQDATDQTLEPVSITMEGGKVVISANQTLTTVNGKVYVKVATTLAGLATAEWTEATLDEGKVQVTPGSSDTAGFYKIKVDF